jgi:phenylalanyl-tRNA synthetase beta chain
MKFSEQWLREWVDPAVTTTQLVEQLTMAGLEVDAVEPVASVFTGVVVGEVLAVDAHPDADKLRVCRVSVGGPEPLQIVCGAANVRVGMRVPAALVGAALPGGVVIKKAKLRGVESSGMLCSARELDIAEDAEGLLELPASATPGADVRAVLQLDDNCIEVDLTPNRGDCLGLAGIAREIGVLNRCVVSAPDIAAVTPTLSETIQIDTQAPQACPRYLGRVVRGLNSSAQTPLWMKERLRRSGMRSLGPLVDVTNYVLLELGQPMHAFDLSRLQGAICVRWAKVDERITLLDGKVLTLDAQTLVIADNNGALALAGVMGGLDTAVSAATDSVLLECAFFTPAATAGRARRYGLQTDSAYRFERGVDPNMQRRAMERATGLLLSICGGDAGPIIENVAETALPVRQAITLRRARISRLLGMALPDSEITDVLTRLGMAVENHAEGWRVTPPGFRFDITLEADLIEELARVHGYNQLPSSCTVARLNLTPQPETTLNIDRVRQLMVDRGYQEIVTYSFIDPALQRQLDPDREPIKLANPLSSELSVMRTQLWPGLIKTLIHNQNRQQTGGRYFEIGLNYVMQDNEIIQDKYIGCLVSGPVQPEQWGTSHRPADFFDIKADAEELLSLIKGAGCYQFKPASHPALHPGQAARIDSDGVSLGYIGLLHPDLERQLGLPDRTLLLELSLSAVQGKRLPQFNELSKFPTIRRDLAVVVPDTVPADSVTACIRSAAGNLLQSLAVFDVYQGPGVESGRRSIALGLILQDSSRTLKDDDVDAVITRVTARLNQELNATLRD